MPAPSGSHHRIGYLWLGSAIVVLAVVGYLLFSQAKGYAYLSPEHMRDIIRVKLWSLSWAAISIFAIYFLRRSAMAPLVAVFAVSAYFLIQHGYLFRGTEYGLLGQWGDMSHRLAWVNRMMYYQSIFLDWFLKDLPGFYPPGWTILSAAFAWLLGIEAYQTGKWSYYVIYLIYPWLLYFSWRKVLSPAASAATVVLLLVFADRYMGKVHYELISLGIFIPWWLHYVERVGPDPLTLAVSQWCRYAAGALIGGALALLYYYWFPVALIASVIIMVMNLIHNRSWAACTEELLHKTSIGIGVFVISSIYWLPLLISLIQHGSESMQHVPVIESDLDLTAAWSSLNIETSVMLAGIFCAFYFWRDLGRGRLLYFYLACIIFILLDRVQNLEAQTYQSRKIIELAPSLAIAPLGHGVIALWKKFPGGSQIRFGMVGLALFFLLVKINWHTQQFHHRYYETAIAQRVPVEALASFEGTELRDKVFLTDHYVEMIYLPYYTFIPHHNLTMHPAGLWSQRQQFIASAAQIRDPGLLAYALAYNQYCPVDYVFLPLDSATGLPTLRLQLSHFLEKSTFAFYRFNANIAGAPESFIRRSPSGIFEILAPPRSAALDSQLFALRPDIKPHIAAIASGR